MPDHDQLDAEFARNAADLLDRLTDREVPRRLEPALGERLHALVEDLLGALFFLFQQLLGHEALGEVEARRHARHREQVRLGLQEAGEVRAFEERPPTLLRAVVGEKNPAVRHDALLLRGPAEAVRPFRGHYSPAS